MTTEQTKSDADEFAAELESYEPPEFDPMIDVMVYGESGAGKTTLVKTLKSDCMEHGEKCLLLTNDKGEDSILSAVHDPDRWLIPQEIDQYQQIRKASRYLLSKNHPFRWCVMDDATRMAAMMNEYLKNEFGDDVWGRYAALDARFRTMLRTFRDLDVNTLFLAREGTKEDSDRKTPAFPGKALGTGNDSSSVIHEFTWGFRAVREHREGDDDNFYLQTRATDGAEAKCRDEFHVLDDRERPHISHLRKKWAEAVRENLEK